MEYASPIEKLLLASRRSLGLALALVFLVLAAIIGLTTLQIRQGIRQQIAGRDAAVLYAVASLHYTEEALAARGLDAATDALAPHIAPPAATDPVANADPLSVALRTAQLRGVLGVRIYDASGELLGTFPPSVTEKALPTAAMEQLRRLRPLSSFHESMAMSEIFYGEETALAHTPVLEITVPLHLPGRPLAAVAQFLAEGQGIQAEYRQLDRRLGLQALAAYLAAAGSLGALLGWSLRSLRRAHALVADRTRNLVHANRELALAAKTSALGAVTAHLLHGLKNPLAGLQNYVAARAAVSGPQDASADEADWEQAVASARRMQAMVQQVTGVLREETSPARYEVTLEELTDAVRKAIAPVARERAVGFEVRRQVQGALPNRTANLASVILVNLVQNALEATPRGKQVLLLVSRLLDRLVFEVRDEGPGFPRDVEVFMPAHSTKDAGTGIGLALCKQLSVHLGADLTLAANSPRGCTFRLVLPPGAETPSSRTLAGHAARHDPV